MWEYRIVSGRGANELTEAVNEAIEEGFHPIGVSVLRGRRLT